MNGFGKACSSLLLAGLAPLAAQAAGIGFVPVSVANGQNLRVSLTNLIDVTDAEAPPDPCHGSVSFYNAAGDRLASSIPFTLGAGHSAQFAMPQPPIASLLGGQVLVSRRAVIRFAPLQTNPVDITQSPPDPCRAVFAGEEVFDTRTQQTQFVNPGVIRGFNPQPDPPGFVGFGE